jgi:hypothetical protein
MLHVGWRGAVFVVVCRMAAALAPCTAQPFCYCTTLYCTTECTVLDSRHIYLAIEQPQAESATAILVSAIR